MGLHSLTNVPSAASGLEIKPFVEGETIYIVCAPKNGKWRDGNSVSMTTTFVGDHMLEKPQALREMYAHDLALVISMARDAGYAQAQAEIRAALGIRDHR